MADGSLIIKAEIDDKEAQTELNRLTKKIDTLNDNQRQETAENAAGGTVKAACRKP